MPKRDARAQLIVTVSAWDSPVGPLHIVTSGDALCYVGFDSDDAVALRDAFVNRYLPGSDRHQDTGAHAAIHRELERYFSGRLKRFAARLHLFGTDFQMQVWTALRSIPFGSTTTYKALAQIIGNPDATRAVGGAVGRNPIPIIVPCHRVIGEGGALVGFGGGIERKKALLRLEGALLV